MRRAALIHQSGDVDIFLTTDHSASSYGVPVLLIGETAYGPADILPSGMRAGELVGRFLARAAAGPGTFVETQEGRDMARRFLGADPAVRS